MGLALRNGFIRPGSDNTESIITLDSSGLVIGGIINGDSGMYQKK
jgi:hypothetical protein